MRQTILELLSKTLLGTQPSQPLPGTTAPVNTPVLLARPADALDPIQRHLGLQPLQHEVQRLEPHFDGRVDLALSRDGVHALGDAILCAKVGVKVDLNLRDDLEVLRDGDDWGDMSVCGRRAMLGWLWETVGEKWGLTLELLGREVETQVQRAGAHGVWFLLVLRCGLVETELKKGNSCV